MARSSRRRSSSRAARRLRRLAMVGAVAATIAAVRARVLDRDQQRFDAQYGPRP